MVKITNTVFIGHLHQFSINNIDKADQQLYVWLERRHSGYMTKKIVIHMIAVYQIYLLYTTQIHFVLYTVYRHSAASGSPHDALASV